MSAITREDFTRKRNEANRRARVIAEQQRRGTYKNAKTEKPQSASLAKQAGASAGKFAKGFMSVFERDN